MTTLTRKVATTRQEERNPRTVIPLSKSASAHLDTLRGMAACTVLLGHWRNLFFVDWPQVTYPRAWLEPFYFATKFGHQAVIIFFVLSGFLIGRTVLRVIWEGQWSTKHYALHRLVRLELVLIPALLLCWVWDFLGLHLFPQSPFYWGTSGVSILLYRIPDWISLRTFFGNLAFLQTILVTPFGSDNPLWSLANEFWYYVLFPPMAILLSKRFRRKQRILAFSIFAVVAIFIGRGIRDGYFIWLLGVGLILAPQVHWQRLRSYWIALGTALTMLGLQFLAIVWLSRRGSPFNTDFTLGVFVAILLYILLQYPIPVSTRYQLISRKIAGFSYTLYLVHLPFLLFCAAWRGHRVQPTLHGLVSPLAILVIALLYAYGVAAIFEHNTDRVRRRVEAFFGA